MNDLPTPAAVVVGVDGSTAALRAALWAVDEAVSRDIALRLVHALDADDSESLDRADSARTFATAERAVRRVIAAVEATDKPVKIEVDITKGPPVGTLVRASRSAAMVCVGAVGSDHFQPDRVGSTAAAVATSAQCPVAVIHGFGRPTRPHPRWVVVEADKSPDNGVVLGAAVDEARLRNAPLRVITCWPAPSCGQAGSRRGRSPDTRAADPPVVPVAAALSRPSDRADCGAWRHPRLSGEKRWRRAVARRGSPRCPTSTRACRPGGQRRAA